MNKTKQVQRKGRMGIVTNRMSDEVYARLDEKAQKNELSQYIIQLVEKDLKEEFLEKQYSLAEKKIGDFDHQFSGLLEKLSEMSDLLHYGRPQTPVLPVSNESLVDLDIVSDEKVVKSGFEESVDIDF